MPERERAFEAGKELRGEIIPRAVNLIRKERPVWEDRLIRLMESSLKVQRLCPSLWARVSRDPGLTGVTYMYMVGTNGTAAIPDLERAAMDSSRGVSTERAVAALHAVGIEAIPALVRIATNQHAKPRLLAVGVISSFQGKDPDAVPALVQCLKDSDNRIAISAAVALRDFGKQHVDCVSALEAGLRHPDPSMRRQCIYALESFGYKAKSAVPSLILALSDPDWPVRAAATNALSIIQPDALTSGVGK